MKNQKNLALISLILGIVGCLTGVVLVGAVFGIAAIVLGIMSSGKMKNAKDRKRAQIGIITGVVAIAYTAVLYTWVGMHPPVTQKEPLLPETTMSGAQQAGGTESTAPVVTVTPTPSPRPTAKVVPTTRPTQKPTATPTARPTQKPTATPTARPTQKPTAVPTQTPTAVPTQEPTAAPTQEPTAAPTQEPTAAPTQTPTAEPTQEPTKTPAQTPTKTPDTQEEENKESPNAGNSGTDSGKTGTDSGKTNSEKTGTDSGSTDSGKAGTDSGKTDSGKNDTDSGKTDSGKNDTDSGKTDSGKNDTEPSKTGTDSGKTDSGTGSKPEEKALLKIHFLDVGQGACALIESDGHYMLIDGGGRDSSSFTVSYLEQLKIGKFDYLVATHFDEDHIAGLVGVFHKFKVGTVLEPSYKVDTSIYTSFKEAEKNSGAEVVIPEPGEKYVLGDAEFTILAPKKPENAGEAEALPEGSSGNNQSICILLQNGDNKVLFTGDAEQEEEQYLVESGRDIRADVYMVGHHGSSSSSSALLLDAVKPKYGVISCGKGNDYGHPTQELLDRLWDKDVSVFRTDEQGNIIMTSDGKEITWSTSPSETWAPGVIPEKAPDRSGSTESVEKTSAGADGNSEAAGNTYVLNNNSMKFHHPWCSSVEKISAKNYGESSLSRDELIAQGYSPCGNCNP